MTQGILLLLLTLGLAPRAARIDPLAASQPSLPVILPDTLYQPLTRSNDALLQSDFAAALESRPRWASLMRDQKMAVGLVDLSRIDRPRFASINGDKMMYAASLPKIGVLLAAEQSFEDGVLAETPQVLQSLHDMIRVSSNEAATHVIDLLGYERIRSVLMDRTRLFDPKLGGGLWVGKRFASHGDRLGDPLHNISHGATVTQVCRFYHMLATGRLVNPERSRQMLGILADPGLHHKFVHSLERLDPEARLYRKSGTWRIWHSDSVLVWGQQHQYILVGLIEDGEGETILQDLVPVVQSLLTPMQRASLDRSVSSSSLR